MYIVPGERYLYYTTSQVLLRHTTLSMSHSWKWYLLSQKARLFGVSRLLLQIPGCEETSKFYIRSHHQRAWTDILRIEDPASSDQTMDPAMHHRSSDTFWKSWIYNTGPPVHTILKEMDSQNQWWKYQSAWLRKQFLQISHGMHWFLTVGSLLSHPDFHRQLRYSMDGD